MRQKLLILQLFFFVFVTSPNLISFVSAGSIVAKIEDNHVSMQVSTSVNASKYPDWKEGHSRFIASAFETSASKNGMITALGSIMNASIWRLTRAR